MSNLLHLVWLSLGPYMLLKITLFHSFLGLSDVLLYIHIIYTIYEYMLYIHIFCVYTGILHTHTHTYTRDRTIFKNKKGLWKGYKTDRFCFWFLYPAYFQAPRMKPIFYYYNNIIFLFLNFILFLNFTILY